MEINSQNRWLQRALGVIHFLETYLGPLVHLGFRLWMAEVIFTPGRIKQQSRKDVFYLLFSAALMILSVSPILRQKRCKYLWVGL